MWRLRYWYRVVLVDQIPDQDETVIAAGGEEAASAGGPFNTVQGGGVTFELEEGLAWLSDVQNPDDVGI